MTGKRFDSPPPAWNILKRLGQLADGYDADWNRSDAGRISSPVQPVAPRADYCIGESAVAPDRPVSVRFRPADAAVSGADSGEEGQRSDEVREGQTLGVWP